MSRRIVITQEQAADAASEPLDGYFERIVKYIPADLVGAWLAANAFIASADDDIDENTIKWIVFGVAFVLTPLWMLKRTKVPGKPPARVQALVATVAFAVWVFATGGPFAEYDWYEALYGGLLLIGFLLVAGLITPPPEESG